MKMLTQKQALQYGMLPCYKNWGFVYSEVSNKYSPVFYADTVNSKTHTFGGPVVLTNAD
jgi:hypothetical protein